MKVQLRALKNSGRNSTQNPYENKVKYKLGKTFSNYHTIKEQ